MTGICSACAAAPNEIANKAATTILLRCIKNIAPKISFTKLCDKWPTTTFASRPAPYTQPSRPPMFHRHCLLGNPGPSQQPDPVFIPECPPEGYRAIMSDKPVPARHPFQQRKHSTTPLRPLEIIDKPTNLRIRFHPTQQRYDLFILQMMRHERTHDDVHRFLRPIHESIAGHPCDSEFLWRGLGCRSGNSGPGTAIRGNNSSSATSWPPSPFKRSSAST